MRTSDRSNEYANSSPGGADPYCIVTLNHAFLYQTACNSAQGVVGGPEFLVALACFSMRGPHQGVSFTPLGHYAPCLSARYVSGATPAVSSHSEISRSRLRGVSTIVQRASPREMQRVVRSANNLCKQCGNVHRSLTTLTARALHFGRP